MTRWPTLRGIILFFAGLAGEVVLTVAWLKGTEPNQALMLLFGTMMGLPVFLQRDESQPGPVSPLDDPERRDVGPGSPDEPEPPSHQPSRRRRGGPRRPDEDRTW